MRTIIYITRHAEPMRELYNNKNYDVNQQVRNEKIPLTISGEYEAKMLSKSDLLTEMDVLYSSNYVRAVSTAKYIAKENNIDINIVEDLGERKIGIDNLRDLPDDYEIRQFYDRNYKIDDGESSLEVSRRMWEAFNSILNDNLGKKIMIVSHGTALTYLFGTWCDMKEENGNIQLYFDNEMIFDGVWNTPELFRLIFEDDELVEIRNIKYNEKS